MLPESIYANTFRGTNGETIHPVVTLLVRILSTSGKFQLHDLLRSLDQRDFTVSLKHDVLHIKGLFTFVQTVIELDNFTAVVEIHAEVRLCSRNME